MNFLQTGIYIAIGYLCGAVLSEHIFMDLAVTHWTNAWVYFWVVLWPFGLLWYLMVAIGNVLLILLLIIMVGMIVGWVFSRVRGHG